MATLVFDIKTLAEPWEFFDDLTKQSLMRGITQNANSATESESELAKRTAQLTFSPLTASIVALGMYDLERSLGAVYYVGDGTGESYIDGDFTYKERTERELLEDFWEGALSYDIFVTFNGRTFDVPFLLHRSAICGVRPTAELLSSRYLTKQSLPYHVDLLDELTFYGAMKRHSLRVFCRAYDIKDLERGFDEAEVAELFHAKKFRDLATRNACDVSATTELYKKWKQYLAPSSFINAIEF